MTVAYMLVNVASSNAIITFMDGY